MRQPVRVSSPAPRRAHLLAEVRKLRDETSAAVLKKRYAEALEYCRQLEGLQPDEPAWARRAAYCFHQLGRRSQECAALIRAGKGYERDGFARKAAAMYRLALALNPEDQELRQHIGEVNAGGGTGLDSLHARGVLHYGTPSETPPLPEDEVGTDGPQSARPQSPQTSAGLEGASVRSMEERLIDEYELVEFAETEVESE
jgi:tetratricopeptide (TPR) repeat protein